MNLSDRVISILAYTGSFAGLMFLTTMSVTAQTPSDLTEDTGEVFVCTFPELPKMIFNLTRGRETVIVGSKSFTVHRGSGFWSAGPYAFSFSRSGPDDKTMRTRVDYMTGNSKKSGSSTCHIMR